MTINWSLDTILCGDALVGFRERRTVPANYGTMSRSHHPHDWDAEQQDRQRLMSHAPSHRTCPLRTPSRFAPHHERRCFR